MEICVDKDPCRPGRLRPRYALPKQSDLMLVMVLTVPAGGCCNLELPAEAKVADLKQLVALKLDIDQGEQRLLYKGKELTKDSSDLRSEGLCARSIVYVISASDRSNISEPLTVIVKYRNRQRPVEILRQEPLEKLELMAAEMSDSPASTVLLMYCGAIVKGGTPKSHNIVNRAIVLVSVPQIRNTRKRRNRYCSKSQIWTAAKLQQQVCLAEQEQPEVKLQPIKEAESIDDIDDELFNELLKLEEGSEIDSLDDFLYAPQQVCRRRSTKSTTGQVQTKEIGGSNRRIPEFEILEPSTPELNRTDIKMQRLKEVSSVYNSEDSAEMVTMLPTDRTNLRNPTDTYTPAPKPARYFQDAALEACKNFKFA